MPRHIMHHAVTLLAALTPELERARLMHLPRLTGLGDAPAVVGYSVVPCFDGEFFVAKRDINIQFAV